MHYLTATVDSESFAGAMFFVAELLARSFSSQVGAGHSHQCFVIFVETDEFLV